MTDIVILAGARTPIGTFGGTLAALPPIETARHVCSAAMTRAGVSPDQIGAVVFGHVLNTEPRDMYLSRVAAMTAGIPDTVPAMNVNRLCGSGAQAVVSAVQSLMLGDADFAIAGGAESMSRAPYILPAARFGQKMGDAQVVDMMLGALTCPFGTGHMGVTAEMSPANMGSAAPNRMPLPCKARTARQRPLRQAISTVRSRRCRSVSNVTWSISSATNIPRPPRHRHSLPCARCSKKTGL